jgi:Fe-S cluster biogenesis protein NfuA
MENTQEKRVVNIYTESNPNPNSLKFVVNFMLMPEGVTRDFPDAEAANEAPLAAKLFELDYVNRVFYMSNFVTVTKDEKIEWIEIKNEIQQLIKSHLEEGLPILNEKPEEMKADHDVSENDSDLDAKIKSILDEYIRPAVEMDGGAIAFDSFNEGTVKVLLQGSCSGCPSSTLTLKAGIENLLKRMVPEVKEVVAEGV